MMSLIESATFPMNVHLHSGQLYDVETRYYLIILGQNCP